MFPIILDTNEIKISSLYPLPKFVPCLRLELHLNKREFDLKIMPNTIVQDHRNLPNWSEVNNGSDSQSLMPIDMVFNDGHRLSITVYR